MVIKVPVEFDDLNLSPEAYRLYMHLRRLEYDRALKGDGAINKPIIEILDKCQIQHARSGLSCSNVFMELNSRRLIDFEIDWQTAKGQVLNGNDIMLTRVTFLPVEEWI